MAELDLDALEQAARDAGGGCWFSTGWTVGSRGFEVGDLKSRERICSDATERCAEFIAAANPATILELLARLEAAEKERDALRAEVETTENDAAHQKALADSALRVAEGWERKCDALRAKITEMKKQEPVRHEFQGRDGDWYPFINQRHYENTVADGTWPIRALYALPGAQAQPAQKAVAYLDLGVGGYVDVGTDLTDEALAALPKGRHMLGIVGTYGVDGYVPAQPSPSVPECPYPCGWRNLLKLAIEDGAYLARSINTDEPVTENARAVTMRIVLMLRDVLMAINNAAPEAKP